MTLLMREQENQEIWEARNLVECVNVLIKRAGSIEEACIWLNTTLEQYYEAKKLLKECE